MKTPRIKSPVFAVTLSLFVLLLFSAYASAASINVSLAQSDHTASGTASVDLSAEGDLDWAVFANSPLMPSTRMSGASAYTGMSHIGGASESFYNFFAQNSYSWTNGDSPASGSNNLTTNADLGSNGAGIRSTFNIATAGTYRLKFYTTTSDTNLSATASLSSGGVTDTVSGTETAGLQKYEFTVEFATDGADTLTLDIVKAGGSIILAYEAFSLAAVDVTPVPNLNIDSSFSFTNASTAETFQIPYSNTGQEPLSVTGVTVGGTDAAYFTVASFDSSLAVGADGNIALNFNPGAGDRVYDATLTIASNDSDSPNTVVNISVNSGNVVAGCVVDLFIVAGQSNANGLGERANFLSSAEAGPHDVKFYCSWHTNGNDAGSTQNFSDWADQTEAGYTRAYFYDDRFSNGGVLGGDTDGGAPGPSSWFGPEIGFAARALELNLTGGNQLGIIKYAVDGSSLNTSTDTTGVSDWDLTATGYKQGDCWRGFQAAIADAVAKLEADGITPNFKGMIWWQGEGGTSTAGLNSFISAVRTHLANNYGLENSADFPVVITTGGQMVGGSTLESGVAGVDDDVTFVNADPYGQQYQVHVGKSNEGSSDWTGNGINDMYDIGEAYADALATIVEPTAFISDCSGGGTAEPAPGGGYYVDVFMATGQSNAFYPQDQGEANYYGLGRGVEDVIVASGLFSNPTIVKESAPGWAIGGWYGEWIPGPSIKYEEQFFNDSGTATLQVKLTEILAAGNTPRFRGFFWWQGESDGIGDYATSDTSQEAYELRYNGMLATLDADLQALGIDTSQYKIVVNTVSESGTQINNILNYLATQGTHSAKSAIYDAINSPHHGNDDVVDAYRDLHDYDHFEVGRANAQLFLDTFPIVTDGYTISFVNVDGSVTTQTVAEGATPTPPSPINTDTRVFTAWSPTIVAATADATYTAEYGPANGEFVDVFIATGQSNAWGPADDGLWFDSGSNSATYEFGQGIASILESSDEFSNPVVVLEGAPGQAIGSWWWDGNEEIVFNAPNVLYKQQFFDADNPGVGTLDAKFAEIIAAGNTPRFRGLFWFQGENDGGYNGSSTPNPATPDATYKVRWNGFVDQIAADVGSSDFNFVVNTVGMVDPAINNTLSSIASLDSRGAIFDTQVAPYRDMEPGTTDVPNGDVHGYDHFAVGVANAQLFLDTFYSDQPAPSTYTITFINVDDSTTMQTVDAGVVPTPPAGVNTGNRTFTGWPTIVAATANATYTALYTQSGNIVDLFIATGQSNAAWPWDSENQVGTFQFGAGVQAALTASGRFSNPTVVSQGEPGMPIDQWWQSGAPQWAYQKNFFGTYQSQTAALEAKIAEIEASGDTPVFRGVFWFQGEADGQNGTTEADYTERWNSILSQLTSDVGTGDYYFVMNTVGNSGNLINTILTNITNANSRGALFNTQVVPYRTNFQDIHGYDHFAVGEANVQLFITNFVDNNPVGGPYTITFVNVDDSITTQVVNDGVIPNPPQGVNTANRTFSGWPSIVPASEDTTYTALFVGDGSSSVSVSLAQSVSGGQGSTAVDLTAQGDLDWGAWNGELTVPGETMDGGAGFTSLTAIGATTFDGGSFYGENNYSWTNGTPTASGSTSFAGNASIAAQGDGVRLTVDVAAAGTYQLKFYTTTFEVNLDATATLAGSGTSDTVVGNYVTNSTEKYEYTVDFTTGGADTLTLDLVKSDGTNAIFAYEAFSLAAISVEQEVEGLGKLICIGDSLTEASATRPAGEGNWSWRYAFWKHLVDNSIAHQFVGTSSLNYDPANEDAVSVYPDYNGESFVNRHEAYWGLGAVHLAGMLPGNLGILKDQDETPDTAVVFLGGNDIGHDNTVTAEIVRDRIKTIVDNLQADLGDSGNPNIRILLVSILPRFNSDGNGDYTVPKAENTHYESINSLLVTLAADETTASSEVSYLDLATTFNTATGVYYDGVHPNGSGEQIEADAIFGALVELAPTYTITFINVDGTQTTQTVNENEVATPPTGVSTPSRTFTGWPTVAPATQDTTYTALYTVFGPYTITFVNVDDSVTTYTADAGAVLTPPTGVNTATRTFTSWPTVAPASADATYTALYTVDVGSADVVWDGNGVDDLWSTPENWSGDTLPANGQTVAITNGDTVDLPANYWDLVSGLTVNVAGNSRIGNTGGAGRLYGPSTYNFLAGSGITGQWIYLHQVTLNFENGATFDASTVEHRQEITYAITLTSTGFTTLTPGFLRPFGESTWSDVSFDLDVSNYNAANGLVVELIDFSGHDAVFDGTFDASLNPEADALGTLSFDTSTSKVIFTFDSAPSTYEITFVNVDGSETVQTVAENDVATPPAGVNTDTRTFTGWPTVAPATADATYTALYDESATYTITFINVDDSQTTQIVGENQVATPPTGVNTPTRTFTSWPTVAPASADATYTALYDTVAPNTVDIYIVAGQSNAYGHGLISDLPVGESTQDALFCTSWHDTDGNAESTQYFSGLEAQTVAGSSRGDTGSSTLGGSAYFGPEMGFVARANEISLSSNPMAIIKYAVGGTSLTQNVAVSDWDLTATGPGDGDCWRGLQAALADAVTKLEAQNYTPNFKGIVWWQGESGTSATDLNAFIAAVRSLLGNTYGVANSSEFPFVITGHDTRWGTDLETGVAALDPYVGFVNSNDYGQIYRDGTTSFNTHPGSGESVFSTDETGNGLNDMWDIGLAYADEMAVVFSNSGPVTGTYTITFINVDGSATTYTADAGAVLTPPTGVNTATRTFTSWPTVAPASADATYTALYTVDVGSADVVWDGEGADDLWSTPENWSGDTLPANGQTLAITNGDTVDLPANYWDLVGGLTVNVAGNSRIGNTGGAGRLFGPSTYNFLAGSGITGQWIYLHQVTLNFENGATFDASTVEHRQEITYAITLTSTGFTTLTPGFLRPFGESTWSDVSFDLDVSNYNAANGLVVELIDFSGHDALFDGTFDASLNPEADALGTLSFDTSTSKVIFTFDSAPSTYAITFVNVDDSQVVQTVRANEVATPPVGVNTDTRTFTGWPTVAAATADATYTALYDEVLPTYTVTFINVDGTETTQTVSANEVATPPAGVNTDDRTFTSWPTVAPASADVTYTALYTVDLGSADLIWVGGGADNSWSTPENWEDSEGNNAAPGNGQTLAINGAYTVDIPSNNYSLGSNVTVNVAGGAQIDNTVSAARFHTGMVFNFFAGSGIGGAWLQVENTTFNFEDGATFTAATVQHRFTSTYGITFSSTVFTTLTPGELKSWDEETDWADVVFNIDVSEYDANNGLVVELIDFTSHDSIYSDNFTPTVNVTAGTSGLTGTLSFDSASSKVIYTFDSVPTTYEITFVNVDDTQVVQTVAEGVTPVAPSGVSTDTRTFTAWPTIDPATEDTTYTALYDIVLPTFTITFVNVDDTETTQTVDEGVTPVPPAGVSTDTRTFTSWPTIDPATEDATYTAQYEAVVVNTYEISFINVDDSVTTQTVNEDEVATPPAGVNTGPRLFKSWPTVAAATADASYTALYDEIPASADSIWDGDAEDGDWTTAANWNTGTLPTTADDVFVGGLATVSAATGDFASLEIAEGSSVSFAYEYPSNRTFNINGVLDRDAPATVLRPSGSVMNLSSTGSFGASIQWLDLGTNSRLSFADGASFATTTTLELRGATTFDFTLSETGFTTLQLGSLADGGTAGWSDVTFNIDVSAYDTNNGLSIVLMDFASHATDFGDSFNPTLNIIDGGTGIGGALSYNTATSELILSIDAAGNDAPVAADTSYAFDGTTTVDITLSATDIEGDTLTYEVVDGPTSGNLSGEAPNLTYTFSGASPDHDSFTFKVNDGTEDSNVATVSIVYVPRTTPGLWGWLQSKIETDPLNVVEVTTWTEDHADGTVDGITISRVTYELGELIGTQHTATPVIAAYYARPTGASAGDNLPGIVQNHGGGQNALSSYAKYWAEEGYAAICINWGGLNLEERNPNEPASPVDSLHPNTNWDGLPGGFSRLDTVDYPMENPVEEAIFWAAVDPVTYSDGQTLFDIPHPLNSSWVLNGYAARRAITFLQDQPEVDDSKIGVLGWSMGGRTTMMSSTDPRITVLAPAVGGTGYLFEDFWGLPGTARNSSGWQDMDLFKATVADQAYWPHVSAPVMFLNGSNDFNAPFDLATKSLSIHEIALDDVSPTNILVTDPHYNHRVTDPSLASRVLWLRHYLKGDVEFPGISDSELELTTADGIPVFKVTPDTSTSLSIASVDIYYGFDRDSRTRFWRDAGAVDVGTHWEAPLPLFDAEDMMAAHAVITYDLGFTQSVPFGSPTSLLTVASKVHTYYPTGVDDAYSLPADLDTAVHQIHTHDPATLVANGLRETAEISDAIDDPSDGDGLKDWYQINGSNAALWQFYTRKVNDVCYRGGEGALLTFDMTADAANTLVVKIVTDGWNENDQTRYLAYVPIVDGLNAISLSLSDFKRADESELTSWNGVKILGLGSGQAFNLDTNSWSGSLPILANIVWSGGERLLNGVSTAWFDTYGLPRSHDALLQDSDGDGQRDGDEHKAGTNPVDSSSVFKVESSNVAAGEFLLNWQAVAGKTYAVDYKLNLSDEEWTELDSGITGVEPTTQLDIELDSELSTCFFRVRVE